MESLHQKALQPNHINKRNEKVHHSVSPALTTISKSKSKRLASNHEDVIHIKGLGKDIYSDSPTPTPFSTPQLHSRRYDHLAQDSQTDDRLDESRTVESRKVGLKSTKVDTPTLRTKSARTPESDKRPTSANSKEKTRTKPSPLKIQSRQSTPDKKKSDSVRIKTSQQTLSKLTGQSQPQNKPHKEINSAFNEEQIHKVYESVFEDAEVDYVFNGDQMIGAHAEERSMEGTSTKHEHLISKERSMGIDAAELINNFGLKELGKHDELDTVCFEGFEDLELDDTMTSQDFELTQSPSCARPRISLSFEDGENKLYLDNGLNQLQLGSPIVPPLVGEELKACSFDEKEQGDGICRRDGSTPIGMYTVIPDEQQITRSVDVPSCPSNQFLSREKPKTDERHQYNELNITEEKNTLSSVIKESPKWNQTVILDVGEYEVKAGVSGVSEPVVIVPNVVGRPRFHKAMAAEGRIRVDSSEEYELHIGQQALALRGVVSLEYPMQKGKVKNRGNLECVLKNALQHVNRKQGLKNSILQSECDMDAHVNGEISYHSEDTGIVFVMPTAANFAMMEWTAEFSFENIGAKGLRLARSAGMALHGSGRVSGLVVESGDSATSIMPLYHGYALTHATRTLQLGGSDVTRMLLRLLCDGGAPLQTVASHIDIARVIKEERSFVEPFPSMHPQFVTTSNPTAYTLPDGKVIRITSETSAAPEILFKPSMIGLESPSLPDLITESVSKCDIDLRKDMWDSVVLSGGNTLFPGFSERLCHEIKGRIIASTHVNIIESPRRNLLPFMGASLVSELSSFQESFITKEMYEEHGSRIIHRVNF